jgi:predicted HAD superfamily Cof-like phosphohydrolase
MITGEDIDRCHEELREQVKLRNMTPLDMVREFSVAMGQKLDQKWQLGSSLEEMRYNLIHEEYVEVGQAEEIENILKELADLVYVTYGYAATFGLDLDEAVRRIHASNMSKLGDDGKPLYREDGKVLKSANYQPPYLGDLVQ